MLPGTRKIEAVRWRYDISMRARSCRGFRRDPPSGATRPSPLIGYSRVIQQWAGTRPSPPRQRERRPIVNNSAAAKAPPVNKFLSRLPGYESSPPSFRGLQGDFRARQLAMTPQRILRYLRAQATNFYKDCDGGIARIHTPPKPKPKPPRR